ncbi:MAG: HK97 gp10 family phage protein, partial [Pigmentiphaga sp.]
MREGRRGMRRLQTGVAIEGMDELHKKLNDVLPREARNILRRTTLKIASSVRNKVRQRAPVDTGKLKRSIKSKRDKGT